MKWCLSLALLALVALAPASATAQQQAATEFTPVVENPAYATAAGPVVAIDEGHHNFHTLDGRYAAFAAVVAADGYQPRAHEGAFTAKSLAGIDILVISNALHPSNQESWDLPNPSAFTEEEIAAVGTWVEAGGSLFLIADHMPFGGAASALAERLGFAFQNGFAGWEGRRPPDVFTREAETLADHEVTSGIDSVGTFTGQAFTCDDCDSVIILGPGARQLFPEKAWVFTDDTPRTDVEGWLQLGVAERGRGRVAMSGEAAMFTAQRAGPNSPVMGMGAPGAEQNQALLLNILHWLTPDPE